MFLPFHLVPFLCSFERYTNTKQGNRPTEEFAAELENIAEKMAAITIRRNGVATNEARTAVKTIYKGQALVAFTNGLKNNASVVF
jgi:hypothetical protein